MAECLYREDLLVSLPVRLDREAQNPEPSRNVVGAGLTTKEDVYTWFVKGINVVSLDVRLHFHQAPLTSGDTKYFLIG